MRRLLGWALAAALAAVGGLWLLSRAHPPEGAPADSLPPPPAAPPGAASGAGAAAPLPAPAAPVAEPAAATPPAIRRRPAAPSSVDWASVPEAARVADLGPALARPVYDALQAAREQMDGCFEEERRREAHPPATNRADSADSSTVLVLRLQSRSGALDVVGAEVEARGDASEQLLSCCRIVLEGWPIPAPGAAPGERYRLKFLLR